MAVNFEWISAEVFTPKMVKIRDIFEGEVSETMTGLQIDHDLVLTDDRNTLFVNNCVMTEREDTVLVDFDADDNSNIMIDISCVPHNVFDLLKTTPRLAEAFAEMIRGKCE